MNAHDEAPGRRGVTETRLAIYQRDDKAVTDPEHYCRDRWCKDTNWGGSGRLHIRGEVCPPFNAKSVALPLIRQYELEDEMRVKNDAYRARLKEQSGVL